MKTPIIFKSLNKVSKQSTSWNVKQDNGCRENTAKMREDHRSGGKFRNVSEMRTIQASLRSKRFCTAKNYRAMNGVSEIWGKGKETLADKPLDFENRPHANRDVMLS